MFAPALHFVFALLLCRAERVRHNGGAGLGCEPQKLLKTIKSVFYQDLEVVTGFILMKQTGYDMIIRRRVALLLRDLLLQDDMI